MCSPSTTVSHGTSKPQSFSISFTNQPCTECWCMKVYCDLLLTIAAVHDETTRIVTLRLYSGTKASANAKLQQLLRRLRAAEEPFGFTVRSHPEQELAIYDNNVQLDRGWIHGA